MKRSTAILLALLLLMGLSVASCGDNPGTSGKKTGLPTEGSTATNSTGIPLTIPQGFSISVFASGLEGPRVIAWDPAGNMLVSLTRAGRVLVLPDADGDGRSDGSRTVAEGLNRPHGLAFLRSGGSSSLYIAESDGVAAYSYDPESMSISGGRRIVDLPDGGVHFTRTIVFAPGSGPQQLLISVGSDCNACLAEDWRRAKILVCDEKGSGLRPYASGLRNSVFMAVHPMTAQVWATENGRDLLGDDIPPDEINLIEDGKDYGWPVCYGKNVPDTEFDSQHNVTNPAEGKTPSHIDIQAHSAPLGLDFIPAGWPREYSGDLIVALHGSWNRSVPTGYKLIRVRLDANGGYQDQEDFISGWLQPDGSVSGRPVGVSFNEGVLYVTDDRAGNIYRISPGP